MRRGFLVPLLLIGTVGGYAFGFAHMGGCFSHMREMRERHIADVCVEAARRATISPSAPPVAPPPPAAAPAE